MDKLRVACVQMNSRENWRQNFEASLAFAEKAIKRKAKLVLFPENFCYRGPAFNLEIVAGQFWYLVRAFAGLAKKKQTAILLGSLPEKASFKKKYYNASVLITEKGSISIYRKIHLFDANLKGIRVLESKHILPGNKIVTARIHGIPAGLSICYDLRFPELYRLLSFKGAKIIFVPANFTQKTGRAHWGTLLRARAIENQAFILAPAQTGPNPDSGILSFGHSLIIDPWGRILAEGSENKEQILLTDLNLKLLASVRISLPALRHRKIFGAAIKS